MNYEFYRGKRVFITGHTGFKGTWLSKILLYLGAEVKGYSLKPETEPNLYNLLELESQMESVIGDIRDLDKLTSEIDSFNPEIIFHLAAQPLVRESYRDPVTTYATNVMGTVNLLEAVRRNEAVKSVVNVTTDKVYENKEWQWAYRENENLCGFDPYSNSKSCSELVTYSYKKSFFESEGRKIAISTARAGNVIGGGDFSADRIIPDCFRAAINKKDITVRNPLSIRPYQHVIEPLMAYLKIAMLQYDSLELAGEYNIGPDEKDCVNTGKLTTLFVKEWGENLKWINLAEENAPHEASFLKLDNSKAKAMLNIYPVWSIEETIKRTVEFYKSVSRADENLNKLICSQVEVFLEESRL